MRTCKEVSARLSQGLDEPIPVGERMTLRVHMMMCKYCARYFDQIRTLRELAKGYEATEIPPHGEDQRLSSEARERIARAVDKAQQDSTD